MAGGPERGAGGRAEIVAVPGRPRAWTLLVNGVPQSHVDLGDPWHLEFEYTRRVGHLLDLAAPAAAPLRVLHLGGGGLTLARYVAVSRPGSRQMVAEADPDVAALVRRWLPLDEPGGAHGGAGLAEVRIRDARALLEDVPAGSADVVIADAFSGGQTPAHLTSVEFTRAAARALAPGGIFVANIGDGPPLAHARGRIAAIRAVFRHVCVIAGASVLRGRAYGNLVAAGSGRALPVAGLIRRTAGDPFPARVVDGAALAEFAAGAPAITDAGARPSPPPPPGILGWL